MTVLSNTKDRYKNEKGLSEEFEDNGHSAVRMIFQKIHKYNSMHTFL